MARLLLLTDCALAPPDGRMAGLQVRVFEMARALAARGHEVTVAEPAPGSGRTELDGFRLAELQAAGRLPAPDAWIAIPRLARRWRRRLGAAPLVLDGYETPFGSFLAYAAAQWPRYGRRVLGEYRDTVAEFLAALARADRVLAATPSQRVLYLTLLCALGRINPRNFGEDPVVMAPSGTSPEIPPAAIPEALRPDGGPVVLWAGGCYPWFDVETYLRAMPLVLRGEPRARFLFAGLGGRDHRGDGPSEHPLANRLRQAVAGSPELEARSRFLEWLRYAERGLAYAAADVGVCTYGDHLETLFSMRTRILDMIWGGLPVVASRGDALSDCLEREEIGTAVPAGDPAALAGAILRLLRDPALRRAMSARARRLAVTSLSWERQVEPLHRYCLQAAAGTHARAGRLKEAARALLAWRPGDSPCR
jgi:hypothetical protein